MIYYYFFKKEIFFFQFIDDLVNKMDLGILPTDKNLCLKDKSSFFLFFLFTLTSFPLPKIKMSQKCYCNNKKKIL